jgi:hypothetical protein
MLYPKPFVVLLLAMVAGCTSRPPTAQGPSPTPATADRLSVVTTAVPFPRGLALHQGDLYVLSRGRVRDAGGTDVAIDDRAGTIWKVSNPTHPSGPNETTVLASPTSPPFRLLNRSLPAALDDTQTDRPYCILRYDPATSSFYFCAFSGIDKPLDAAGGYFRKNRSDAVFRFDLRTMRYYELVRGSPLDGPNNCLVVGQWLYVVNKESSTLYRYDLSAVARSPEGRVGPAELVAGSRFLIGGKPAELLGHSALAVGPDGGLYLGFRTSSAIVRIDPRDLRSRPSDAPVRAQLIAQFQPYSPSGPPQADLTDIAFGPDGSLYVVGAKPARVWRFFPSSREVFTATSGSPDEPAWAELHRLTRNPKMKIESVIVDPSGNVFVTSADRHPTHGDTGLAGVVYRLAP